MEPARLNGKQLWWSQRCIYGYSPTGGNTAEHPGRKARPVYPSSWVRTTSHRFHAGDADKIYNVATDCAFHHSSNLESTASTTITFTSLSKISNPTFPSSVF